MARVRGLVLLGLLVISSLVMFTESRVARKDLGLDQGGTGVGVGVGLGTGSGGAPLSSADATAYAAAGASAGATGLGLGSGVGIGIGGGPSSVVGSSSPLSFAGSESALAMAKEWTQCQDKKTCSPKRTPGQVPRPLNYCLVNTDAAWEASNQIVGLRWTIKNPCQPSMSFASPALCVGSALSAEGLAMREALTKCKALNFKLISCASDSSQFVYGIVSDISDLLVSFDVCS